MSGVRCEFVEMEMEMELLSLIVGVAARWVASYILHFTPFTSVSTITINEWLDRTTPEIKLE